MDNITPFGDHLRALRQQRKYSQRALAEAAGIATSFLAKVESDKASPTLATLMKLAEALDLTVAELLSTLAPTPEKLTVVPVAQMPVADDGDRRWRYLFPHHPRFRVVMADEVYQPHTRKAEMEQHPHDLCGVVLSGELTLEIPSQSPVSVHAGEAFYINADTPHIARNVTDAPVHLISVEVTTPHEDTPSKASTYSSDIE